MQLHILDLRVEGTQDCELVDGDARVSWGDRLGTKKDVEDQLQLLQTTSSEMKKLAQEGKCWDVAERDFKLPAYESWPGYAANLQFIARRYCGLWGRGT